MDIGDGALMIADTHSPQRLASSHFYVVDSEEKPTMLLAPNGLTWVSESVDHLLFHAQMGDGPRMVSYERAMSLSKEQCDFMIRDLAGRLL